MTAHLFIKARLRQQLLLLLLPPCLLRAHAWVVLVHMLHAWLLPHTGTCTPTMLLMLVPLLLLLY
jgi:hypothetical protein